MMRSDPSRETGPGCRVGGTVVDSSRRRETPSLGSQLGIGKTVMSMSSWWE